MKIAHVIASVGIGALGAGASAETIVGLTSLQELVLFDSVTRAVTSTTPLVSFSPGGEFIVGIDVRPATGELYGLSNLNNLYRINMSTGESTQIGSPISPAPVGDYRSIDFNPTVDRIRLVSSDGTNLRLHPDTGVVATDGALAFAPGDSNSGDTPGIVNAAYTNSFAGATSTTLYTIDSLNNVLAIQAPPNDGTQNTVGALGFDISSASGFTGFDISGATGFAYLTGNNLSEGGLNLNALYSVDLASGQAAELGAVSGVSGSFRDIAVVPAPSVLGALLLGLAPGMRRPRRPS